MPFDRARRTHRRHCAQTVTELRERLPEPLRDRIEALARRLGPGGRPVLRLLERLLLHASPSLALAPALLGRLAQAWSDLLAAPWALTPPARKTDSAPSPLRRAAEAGVALPRSATAADAPVEALAADAGKPRPAQPPASVTEVRAPPEQPLVSPIGLESDCAGLWLVIPSLIRLGFREWLCERPLLLRRDCGRTLLRTLARHYRVPDGDPALAAFEGLAEIGETPDWARCWRAGLDGWLRRRARIPLHRLVRKRGEVTFADEKLIVRFPLDAADLRLRRRALDVDPGWVDWLGLSVRYRYEGKAR